MIQSTLTNHKFSLSECFYCSQKIMAPQVQNIVINYATTHKQKSPEWDKLRSQLLFTGSSVSVITFKNFFKSRATLLAEKISGKQIEIDNENIRHGNLYEPDALHKCCEIIGHELIPNPNLCYNVDILNGYAGVSPDGITYCGCLVEVKCPKTRKIKQGGKIPPYYLPQVMFSLHVLNLEKCFYFEYDPFDSVNNLQEILYDKNWYEENEIHFLSFMYDYESLKLLSQLES